jgi:hypothetical protein
MALIGGEEPGRKEELQYLLQQLEQEKTRLFEELAAISEEQRARVAEIRKIEKGQRTALEDIEEHIAEEPLSAEDVEMWARSRFFVFARTAPANPHAYAHRRDCDEGMFEAVVRFIRANGYLQWYGGAPYICYDVTLWSRRWFLWTMGAAVGETIILNAKPDSLRPGAPRSRREA